MAQPTYGAIRAALAAYLTSSINLRATANKVLQVNPPQAVVLPVTGTLARYQLSMDGQVDYLCRIMICASLADSEGGQDILDQYIATAGASSVWAAVRADPTLGGNPVDAAVTEVTGYGVVNIGGADYLKADIICEIFA